MAASLNVHAFFDGRLGHEKQTRGILAALNRLTDMRTSEYDVASHRPLIIIADWVRWLKTLIDPSPPTDATMDLIIGSGTATHLPMLIYRSGSTAKIVTCMSPDRIVRRYFDLCCVPFHDRRPQAANLFETIGPPNTSVPVEHHPQDRGLILIGGIDHKSHYWDSAAIMGYIATLCARGVDRHWTIASSPRTPADMVHHLGEFADRMPGVIFVPSAHTPRGWIEQAYAGHADVWVTADSVSMMYEALSAGCRVGLLPVRWKKKNNKFQFSIDYLVETDRLITFDQWRDGSPLVGSPPLNEALRCAREILRRWWPERLP